MYKVFSRYLLLLLVFIPAFATEVVTIGILSDGPSSNTTKTIEYIKKEVNILTKGEFIVNFPKEKHLNGHWNKEDIKASLKQLYNDKEVDIIVVLGFSSAAIAVNRAHYSKPTLVATIIHTDIANAPLLGETSAKHNLTYISIQADLKEELEIFQKVVPFKKVALISDALIPKVMPSIRQNGIQASKDLGIDLKIIPHTGQNDIVSQIPEDTDAVVIGALPRMNNQQLASFLQELNKKGLPTHSMVSARLVNLGALCSAMHSSNRDQYIKRFALGIQSVLLGEDLKDLKVFINRDKQLNINMQTLKDLNISPSFETMIDSHKINENITKNEKNIIWSLQKVSREVLAKNLNIASSKLNIAIGKEEIGEDESKLYPQLTVDLSHQKRKDINLDTLATQNGKASISLSQVLYDSSTWANLDIEKLQQKVRQLNYKQTKLDILKDANIAFLNILKATTLKKMQEDNMNLSLKNLKLAKNKANIGSATNADIYRWEIKLADAQVEFLTARSTLKESEEYLNQLLNRPIDEEFHISFNTLDNPLVDAEEASLYSRLSHNKEFDYLSKVFVAYGLNNSSTIATNLSNIKIEERTLKNEKQKNYVPTLMLSGEYSNTYYDDRDNQFSQEGKDDWLIGLNISLPIYEGGGRSHSITKAKHTLNQNKIELNNSKRDLEQNVREKLRLVQISKFSIELKERAADAAQKNYDLVYDAYNKGSMGVIELVDAQNSKLVAKLNAINSTYKFFIDLVTLEHSVGNLEFFIKEYSDEK